MSHIFPIKWRAAATHAPLIRIPLLILLVATLALASACGKRGSLQPAPEAIAQNTTF